MLARAEIEAEDFALDLARRVFPYRLFWRRLAASADEEL
jgi:hypothetical protein